ncbi:MAG: M23 family metallopeptidase [Cyanobacteria bacterium P01_E01_bin.42]
MYDLHFHQYEVTGLNNFDLSWEKVSSLSGYYSELHSLNSDQWDEYTWDNTRFDSPMWDGEIDERWKNPESVKQIYTDLSKAVFGTRFAMTAGYLNDTSYYVWSDKWHAGIDMKSPAGTTVKNVVGGTVSWVHNNGDAKGWFIGVNSNDGNQWVYGHLNKPIVSVGSYVNIGQSLGTISGGSKANHFHLEVQPGHRYNDTNGAHPDKNFVRNVTMSPLQAFWNWKNS